MDEISKNTSMLKKLISKEMADIKKEGRKLEYSTVYVSKNIAIVYAEKTNSKFEIIFPLVSAIFDGMNEKKSSSSHF